MKPTQFVVVHSPGSTWKAGVAAFEQEGLPLHVAHYAKLLEQGSSQWEARSSTRARAAS